MNSKNRKVKNKIKRMKGKGIVDILTYLPKKAYQTIGNVIDPRANLKFGEIHVPQITLPGLDHGVIQYSRYQGPGTDVIDRIKRGSKPITTADKISQAHDLRYSLGVNERKADNKMLNDLNLFNPNNWLGYAGIKAKTILEDLGISKNGTFASTGFKGNQQEKQMLQGKLSQLEKQGYGRRKNRK